MMTLILDIGLVACITLLGYGIYKLFDECAAATTTAVAKSFKRR